MVASASCERLYSGLLMIHSWCIFMWQEGQMNFFISFYIWSSTPLMTTLFSLSNHVPKSSPHSTIILRARFSTQILERLYIHSISHCICLPSKLGVMLQPFKNQRNQRQDSIYQTCTISSYTKIPSLKWKKRLMKPHF